MANIRTAASVSKKLCLFGADARAVAGIEFGVTGLLLVIGLLNAVDVGFYAYRRMEVENAAEAGAQKAWNTCNDPSSMLPATQLNASGSPNCPGLNAAITTAIQSTTLGTAVSLASGYPAEGYYCVNASECPAIGWRRVQPRARELLRRGQCDCNARRLPPSWRYLPISIIIPFQRNERPGDIFEGISDHQDKLDADGLRNDCHAKAEPSFMR
jgi:hypothetical protein